MAVTLTPTLGGETANSYVDMATAVAMANNIPGGGDWIAQDEELRALSLDHGYTLARDAELRG